MADIVREMKEKERQKRWEKKIVLFVLLWLGLFDAFYCKTTGFIYPGVGRSLDEPERTWGALAIVISTVVICGIYLYKQRKSGT